MLLIAGQDKVVADWAGRMLGTEFVQPLSALGVVADEGGLLMGAAIFNDYHPGGNISFSYVGPGTLSRDIIRQLVTYAFEACRASRVTIQTRRSNRMVRKLLGEKRHGFEFEGVRKRYYDTTEDGDALCFVLFPDQAKRWSRGGKGSGSPISRSN